jgi:WD40 repeat protein
VVLAQLREARVNLASTLVQRARRAEDVSDWARAAAYYAASRVENDSMVARWGIALARQRLPERESIHTGLPGTFSDVDVLPDGTVVALEVRDSTARLYAVDTGRTLWTVEGAERIRDARISSGAVRLSTGRSIRVLDERAGNERFTSDPDHETLCRNGPPVPASRIERSGVLPLEGSEGPFVQVAQAHVRAEPAFGEPCAVSEQGDRLAIRDPNGVVRLWDLEQRREMTSRDAPDTQEIVFTAHGVALVRGASLQLFGGPEGDYSIEIPGRSVYGSAYAPARRGVTVSADGHRVVVDNPTLNRAEVLDLRDRATFVSVTRPPGEPSYAFSADGSKLYAAGLADAGALLVWNLRRPAPRAGGPLEGRVHLEAGRERFILFENHHRVELRSEDGSLLRTIEDPDVLDANLSADGSTLAIAHPEDIAVRRMDDGPELARLPCQMCLVVLLSADGSRLAAISRERRRVWELPGASLVRDEPMGAVELRTPFTLSPVGDRLGWIEASEFVLEDLASGSVRRLSLPGRAEAASISPDGTQVVVSLPGSLSLWKVPGMEPVWAVPNPSSVRAAIGWSVDGSIVTIAYQGAGALLLDARTGESLARVVAGRSGVGASQVDVLPGLRFLISRGPRSWALRPLPGQTQSRRRRASGAP